jgi:hypothetical protein
MTNKDRMTMHFQLVMIYISRKVNIVGFAFFFFASCDKKEEIKAVVYSKDKNSVYTGCFYTTKYGGLNFFVYDKRKRNELLETHSIDSIYIYVNDDKYTAKPAFFDTWSSKRNNSDFNFGYDKRKNELSIEMIDNKQTLVIIAEQTDLEKLKKEGKIPFLYVKQEKHWQ